MPSYYVIFIVLLVLYILHRRRNAAAAVRLLEQSRAKETIEMVELAKRFVGKECLITAFDGGHQFEGVVREVSDGAVLVEKDGKLEAINLNFVIRIREYPRNKKGKKKSVILD